LKSAKSWQELDKESEEEEQSVKKIIAEYEAD
jgi:hypothetical protein